MGSTHLPPLRLFMARHVSTPTQRVANSTASAQTMCCKRDLFDSRPPLLFSRLATPGNGKTIPAQDAGDTPKQALMPLIASDHMPRNMFTKNKLSVRKCQTPEHRAQGDIPNVNHLGGDSQTLSQKPTMVSTAREAVPPQLNKPKSNELDDESRKLATMSASGHSHLTIDGIHPKANKAEGLACGTDPQRKPCSQTCSNSPGGKRAPMSAMEGPDELTTHAPALNHKGKAVNESGSASVPSNRTRSCQQGISTAKFEFGDERIKTDVRSDEKQTDEDGLTFMI